MTAIQLKKYSLLSLTQLRQSWKRTHVDTSEIGQLLMLYCTLHTVPERSELSEHMHHTLLTRFHVAVADIVAKCVLILIKCIGNTGELKFSLH